MDTEDVPLQRIGLEKPWSRETGLSFPSKTKVASNGHIEHQLDNNNQFLSPQCAPCNENRLEVAKRSFN